MKHRLLALLLVFALALSPAAMASQALGWELYQTDTVLGPGFTVSTQTLWGDSKQDYRVERYATYTPGQGVTPVVAYGSTLTSTGSLTSMAKALEGYGNRVLAGANGDYFVMASGVPLGMVVTYGALRSSSSYHYAVGFRADGSAFVGKPELNVFADFHGYHLSVAGGYNKTREAQGGYTLYSSDFGSSTKASGNGLNVILRPVSVPADYVAPAMPQPLRPAPEEPPLPQQTDPADPDQGAEPTDHDLWEEELAQWEQEKLAWEQEMAVWKWDFAQSVAGFETLDARLAIGGELTCVVESVAEQSGAVSIPQGRLVMSIDKRGADFLVGELEGLLPGEQITLSVTSPDPRWAEAETAIGAYAQILQNGEVPSGLEQTAGPRTALGIKPNGQVILYTIDGRKPGHSVGASVAQVARRLQELGCNQAVLFDGGGSTTFGTTGALDQTFSLQNTPSEGSQRAVTNALFFVTQLEPTGTLGSIYLEPQSALLLAGGRQSLVGKGIDTGFYPMGGGALSGLSYTVDGPGRMEGDTFIAGSEKGVATVTAKTQSGASGTARMTVVSTPDVITLLDAAGKALTALNLDPGQSAALNASASWYKLPLLADDSCFTWSLSPELGSVDAYGNLTAGAHAAAGTLTVSAGEKSVSIPVTVGGHVTPMEDFEGGECQFRAVEGAEVSLSAQRVKYGHQAMEILCRAETAQLETYMDLNAGETDVGLWVYPEGEMTLEVLFLLQDGSEVAVPATLGGPGSWSYVSAALPETAQAIAGLRITSAGAGTLYVDQITSTNGGICDQTPPTVKLTAQNGVVTATLSDNVDKTFDAARLELTLDGYALPYELSGNTLTAQLPLSDALLHRVSLTAADASGNLTRAGVELTPGPGRQPPFADVADHWAKEHIVYLFDQGVTNGRLVGDTRIFDPQTNITRGEFATMLCRWMRLDTGGYDDVALPFVDLGDIPAWALGSVRSLYALGIFTGSLESDGLYANASQPISRCQAMTMLGRVQPSGYLSSQERFADHEDIPAWAAEYVYTLAAQGVVSGYEGYVRPLDPVTRGEVAKLLTTLW